MDNMTDTMEIPFGDKGGMLKLAEPRLKHLLAADKLLEKDASPGQERARDIRLLALVAGVDEAVIRDLPVTAQNSASAFLEAFEAVDRAPEHDPDAPLLLGFPEIRTPGTGESYAQLHLSEPTTGAMEAAERALHAGRNPYTARLFQQALIARAGDLPAALVPELPVSVANAASRYLSHFRNAGLPTGGR